MIFAIDERRDIALPGKEEETVSFALSHWLESAKEAISKKGSFFVALSGGSTPKKIFSKLTPSMLDWEKVYLFWSDERCVSLTHPDSNYKMAMDAGFKNLPIPSDHIFPMHAEDAFTEKAAEYEEHIKKTLKNDSFDLVMLGMGEDGHTASLFPGTKGLEVTDKWVIINEVPQKKSFRMSFTFPLINQAKKAVFYVLGDSKQKALKSVLFSKTNGLPASYVGTKEHPALWIVDEAAAKLLPSIYTQTN